MHFKHNHFAGLASVFLMLVPCFMYAADGVLFSEPSGVKTKAFLLTLTTDDPRREIFYTTDGSVPTMDSEPYENAFAVFESTMVSAISYLNGVPDEFVSKAGYTYLSEEVEGFTSDLPVFIIDNLNQGALPNPPADAFMSGGGEVLEKQFAVSALFEPVNGLTRLNQRPTIETNAGVKVRGSSSSAFPKKSYGLDSWDYQCQEEAIEPLGLAESADWVLFGSRLYDPTYIRSVLPYTLSNQMGQWAPNSVAIEMFVNLDGGKVTMDDYLGVYFFMEKIGRGKDKIDIEKLDEATQPTDPEISGGYILKVDRLDAGAEGFTTLHSPDQYSYNTTNYYYPKERNMPDYQKPWIRNYVEEFESALKNIPTSREYTQYFDVQAAVDHWLLKAMPMEFDAFILSEFMYKPQNGTIHMGPIWDLDRSAGSLDTRNSEPTSSWEGGGPVKYMEYGWYGYLFNDPEFYQAVKDRWFQLRQDVFSVENLHGQIDSLADVMGEAMARDVELWPIDAKYGGTFEGAINFYKEWLEQRVVWIDEQFGFTPVFLNRGAELEGNVLEVAAGYQLTMQNESGAGEIYYTTDGTDPRAEGGAIGGSAKQYTTVLSIDQPSVLTARVYNNGTWSSFRKLAFYIDQDLSKLKITEINYNPASINGYSGSDLEFIELKNTGSQTLNLTGLSFSDGVEFTFPVNSIIAPGSFILLASNAEAFAGATGIEADYSYEKGLSNSGEHLALSDAFGELITEVEYDDKSPWAETADGLGYTLVPININPIGGQDEPAQWRSSSAINGSPKADDLMVDVAPVVISEALANSDNPPVDAIELFNPTGSDVDVSGWLLNDKLSTEGAWVIPSGTVVGAGEYVVFYEGHINNGQIEHSADEFGTAFLLGADGDEVYLLSAENGNITGYANGYDLEPSLPDVSYGRYTISTGEEHITGYKQQTFGSENSEPRVGPVVISQIMYNPQEIEGVPENSKFVQITNISDTVVKLYDVAHPENTWKLSGLNFNFPQATELAPGEIAYVKSSKASDLAFRRRYELSDEVQVFTFSGIMDKNGESLSLRLPLEPKTENGEVSVAYAVVDRVKYKSSEPWPVAGGNGMMLERIDLYAYGNDPANWKAVEGIGRQPDSYELRVENGSGSGTYAEGYYVIVNADYIEGKSFFRWTGSGAACLGDVTTADFMLVMPSESIELVAEYVDVEVEKLISSGDQWKYNNRGQDLGTSWRDTGYNDGQWQTGRSSIGTDGAETVISIGNMWMSNPTTYFRKSVTLIDADNVSEASVRLACKDGAVVYINGEEACRAGVPSGEVTYNTNASADVQSSDFKVFAIDPSLFVEGENVVQVEVHVAQAFFTTVDMYFDLELSTGKAQIPRNFATQYVALNEGWNLVTLYVEPYSASINSLFPNATEVKTDDAFYNRAYSPLFNTINELHAGDAVLIYNSKDEQLSVSGTLFTSAYSYKMKPGLNLVGIPRSINYPLLAVPNEYLKIEGFDGSYRQSSPNAGLKEMQKGKAYFIDVSASAELFFEGE